MNKKTKVLIGLIGSLIICLFGVYRLITEIPTAVSLLIVPIVFTITGFVGVIGNIITFKKINNDSY